MPGLRSACSVVVVFYLYPDAVYVYAVSVLSDSNLQLTHFLRLTFGVLTVNCANYYPSEDILTSVSLF